MLDQAVKEALEQLSPREQEVCVCASASTTARSARSQEVGKEFGRDP